MSKYYLTHLQELESEAIYVIREVCRAIRQARHIVFWW